MQMSHNCDGNVNEACCSENETLSCYRTHRNNATLFLHIQYNVLEILKLKMNWSKPLRIGRFFSEFLVGRIKNLSKIQLPSITNTNFIFADTKCVIQMPNTIMYSWNDWYCTIGLANIKFIIYYEPIQPTSFYKCIMSQLRRLHMS